MRSASKRRPGLFVPLPLDLADDHRTIGLSVAAPDGAVASWGGAGEISA